MNRKNPNKIKTSQNVAREITLTRAKNLGLSNRAIARETGISDSSISRFLKGYDLDIDNLAKLSNWLNMELSAAMGLEVIISTNENPIQSILEVIEKDKYLDEFKKQVLSSWFKDTYKAFKENQHGNN